MTEKEPEKISLARLLVEFPPRENHNACNGKGFYLFENMVEQKDGEGHKIMVPVRVVEVCRCVGNQIDKTGRSFQIETKPPAEAPARGTNAV